MSLVAAFFMKVTSGSLSADEAAPDEEAVLPLGDGAVIDEPGVGVAWPAVLPLVLAREPPLTVELLLPEAAPLVCAAAKPADRHRASAAVAVMKRRIDDLP